MIQGQPQNMAGLGALLSAGHPAPGPAPGTQIDLSTILGQPGPMGPSGQAPNLDAMNETDPMIRGALGLHTGARRRAARGEMV